MARVMEPTPEQEAGWKEWVASRPENVRAVAERFEPWSLYKMKPSGHLVTVYSFGEAEDGKVSLTVNVSAEFNLVMFERQVFGINSDDLEPCDVPSDGAPRGAMFTHDEVDENIDALRVMVRPDLWEMGEDGKVRRRDN